MPNLFYKFLPYLVGNHDQEAFYLITYLCTVLEYYVYLCFSFSPRLRKNVANGLVVMMLRA